ncbi:PepSY domain-containing protein [Nocardioides sp. zg-ZUI104]|uniref:PepSY domain-containing protein n=1 Tax=Nocardioides faecalis TaxID=2803858 RepID=UPI001BD13B49|nr:PepSY domain-containing protein [Nocardioides faecalis]MBS4754007.1 PepSY domain-containing protein [Nocardioides faecalis]
MKNPITAKNLNLARLRTKRVLVPTVAAAAILGAGGAFWGASASTDDVRGGERDRVATAAVATVGEGTAVEVETSDDAGEAYEVEVRREDGTEVDVTLDDDLTPVAKQDDTDDTDTDDTDTDDTDTDDRPVPATERASAEKAALAAVGGGTVLDVEAGDDPGVAYDVEVRDAEGAEWDVDLDASFAVVTKTLDD